MADNDPCGEAGVVVYTFTRAELIGLEWINTNIPAGRYCIKYLSGAVREDVVDPGPPAVEEWSAIGRGGCQILWSDGASKRRLTRPPVGPTVEAAEDLYLTRFQPFAFEHLGGGVGFLWFGPGNNPDLGGLPTSFTLSQIP